MSKPLDHDSFDRKRKRAARRGREMDRVDIAMSKEAKRAREKRKQRDERGLNDTEVE